MIDEENMDDKIDKSRFINLLIFCIMLIGVFLSIWQINTLILMFPFIVVSLVLKVIDLNIRLKRLEKLMLTESIGSNK